MCYEIVFANEDAEAELREILIDSDMDLAGDIQEHVLIKKDDEILGGAMMAQLEPDVFHLLVFAIKQGERNSGTGSRLLKELITLPRKYCQDSVGEFGRGYIVTTVAKGDSAKFYKKNGFIACDFSDLADPFSQQCDECPHLSACNPEALKFLGDKGDCT